MIVYAEDAFHGTAVDQVLLDGKVIDNVTVADTDKGEVTHMVGLDQDPIPLSDAGEYLQEVLHGEVTIILNPGYRFDEHGVGIEIDPDASEGSVQ